MLPEVRDYLQEIRFHLRLEPKQTENVIEEINSHIQEKFTDLRLQGSSEREAARLAVGSFGKADEIAHLMSEAFARGSWGEAAMAVMPHLGVAWLFASHLWRNLAISSLSIVLIAFVSLIGLRKGRPSWVYTWVGYLLVLLSVIAYLSASTFRQWMASTIDFTQGFWSLIFISALLTFALSGFLWTAYRVIKRDWILASLMMLPVPATACWLFALQPFGSPIKGVNGAPIQIDSPVAITALILAVAVLVFVRGRTRETKIIALLSAGTISLPLIAYDLWSSVEPVILLVLALVAMLILLVPKQLESILGHESL